MEQSPYPVVRLNPKGDARAIRHGFPWVYANEVVTDRRTKGLTAGTIAILEDAERRPMGLVAVNPNSKIFCRMLSRDVDVPVDAAWFERMIGAALQHRETLYAEPNYRLVHAEADGMPGVVIDRFGDVAVVQPNAAWADVLIEMLVDALVKVTGVGTVIMNGTGRARSLEGLQERTDVLRGQAPTAPIPVEMNGATYMADVMGGQKTGIFFDQRPNHAFAANLSKGARVLDVFSHFATLEALAEEGAQFDVVICDPPAFAPGRKSLDAGLRAYERVARLAAGLVKEGGYLGVCSCSHAADLTKFRNASARGIGRAGKRSQVIYTGFAGPDHPLLPHLAESGYLKAVFFRL